MFNPFPLWKYITFTFVILISLLYALPNLYGEDPAIKITSTGTHSTNEDTLVRIQQILQTKKITSKSLTLERDGILARFDSVNTQLYAREVLMSILGARYALHLTLVPSTPGWLSILNAKPITLGLDLRGGLHFLMEGNVNIAVEETLKSDIESLRSDLQKKGIPYISVNKKDQYGINIVFKDRNARNLAINYLTPRQPNLILSTQGSNQLSAMMTDAYLKKIRESSMKKNMNILIHRINRLGITDPLVQQQGHDRISIELPGIQDSNRTKEVLEANSTVEFRSVNTETEFFHSIKRIPDDSEIKETQAGQPVLLYKRIILTGEHILNSTFSKDEYNQPQVNITLNSIGGNIMSNFSKNNIGKPIAALLAEYKDSGKKDSEGRSILIKEEKIISIANIQSHLGSKFCITGIKSSNEARQLAILLQTGTLMMPMRIIEEQTIGPTLGASNVKQGIKACLISLIFSMIFMIFFYKNFGLIAASALMANLMLIIAIMSLLPGVSLTMPGIAGIVLTLAVAIDANVLINERIKEELRKGFSAQKAINEGYKRAFNSIFDTNTTTLITVFILYIVGTGTIKGFAITTGIGVGTSMFTAVFGTRAIINLLYGGKKVKKLSI